MNFYLMKSIISRAPPCFCPSLFCVLVSSLVANHRTPADSSFPTLIVTDHLDLLMLLRICF